MITPDLYKVVLGIRDPDASSTRCFDVHGQIVRVSSSSETVENLRSFFYPYILSDDNSRCANNVYDLTTVFEPQLYDYIKANISNSPDEVLTTALTHDFEYDLACHYSESNEIAIIEDEPLKLFYVVSKRARVTKVIAAADSRIQTGLLRIIRGAWVLSHDGLIVHGCVMEKQARGIVIAGEKRAGKSTALLNLCSRKHYNVVANDRLLLGLNQSTQRLRAMGVPTVVKLRRDTVKPFPELQNLIDLPLFGVSSLAKELKVEVKPDVELSAVAFLSYDRACRKPVVRRLSREESLEILVSHLFPRREYDWVRSMKIVAPADETAGLVRRDILNVVSCYQLRTNETQLEESAALLDSWCQMGSMPG